MKTTKVRRNTGMRHYEMMMKIADTRMTTTITTAIMWIMMAPLESTR